jgi:hypothetical protein
MLNLPKGGRQFGIQAKYPMPDAICLWGKYPIGEHPMAKNRRVA